MAGLTEVEKTRIKHHLGYPNVSTAAGLAFGMSIPLQTMFLVDKALNLVPEVALGTVRELLAICENTERRIADAQKRLAAKKVGTIELRDNEIDLLDAELVKWAYKLAEALGCPVYHYSTKFRGGGGMAGSIPVRS